METATSFSRDPAYPVIDETEPNFEAIRDSAEFARLRLRLLKFVFPVSAFFLLWYLTYVLLAAYAHDFMSQRVAGNVTVGLVLGLSQFATTVVIMLWYLSFARRRIDPETAKLRAQAGPGRS